MIKIFGYGSLINIESSSKTVQRVIAPSDIQVCSVVGYKRIWNYTTPVFSDFLMREIQGVYLNLHKDSNSEANGIVFSINENELEKLRMREKYYDLRRVYCHSQQGNFLDEIYTFICNNPEHLAENFIDLAIFKDYIQIVEEGCKSFGNDFFNDFNLLTRKVEYPIIEGGYKFL